MAKSKANDPTETTDEFAKLKALMDGFGGEEIPDFEIDAWYNPEAQRVLIGRVVQIKEIPDMLQDGGGLRKLALIRVDLDEWTGIVDGDPQPMARGQICAVGIRHKSESLEWAEGYDVAMHAVEKIAIGRGKTMWRYKMQYKKDGRPATPKRPPPAPLPF